MKIWVKYLVGCILGIILAYLLPLETLQASKLLAFFTELSLRIGRYALLPLIFFGVAVAVYNLRDTKRLSKITFVSLLIILCSTILYTVIGLISVLIVKLPRIPISVDRVSQNVSLQIPESILRLFPWSGFSSLAEGAFLLPAIVFAFFAGIGCASDKIASKQAVSVLDSISKVCYTVLGYFVELLSVGLVATSCTLLIRFRDLFATGIYNGLILLLAVDFIIITVFIYPLILKVICKEPHPYKVLYSAVAPILASFFTGDSNITLATAMKHSKESLGLKGRANNYILPLFSVFSRGGSALTTAISFVIILRSYSSLSIAFSDILWIGVIVVACSFFLGAFPTGGMYTCLTVICMLYGRGFEAGYLLLKPVVPIICAFACAIDAVTMMLGSYIVANKLKLTEMREIKYFA